MKNYGLQHLKYASTESFTTDTGIKIRRLINKPLRKILNIATNGTIIVDRYPMLIKGRGYIFVATHNFVEDIIATLATIDRSTYLLFGTTDQVEYNPKSYAAWANGFIYVDRNNKKSRKDSLAKMTRILGRGSSVLIFAEGGFNNTENLLCQKLFSGPIILQQKTGYEIVPVAPFYEFGSNSIYMNVGEPIRYDNNVSKDYALEDLRNKLATLCWENLEKHASLIKRKELGEKPRYEYMIQRCQEYQKTKWTKDVWDEELTRYLDISDKEMINVYKSYEQIHIDDKTVGIIAPILLQNQIERMYDFKIFMKENWDKAL